MGEKLIVAEPSSGLKNNRIPPFIDNDSFPMLINAYQWRGRVKRKRGTTYLGQLQRNITASGSLVAGVITLTSPVVPGSINIVGGSDGTTYTDPIKNGNLTATGGTGSGGTINYATGLLTVTGGGTETISGTYSYFPMLPVMGIEDFANILNGFPGTIAFDTKYSYQISTNSPYPITDVSFYDNPASMVFTAPQLGTYTQKAASTPLTWNGNNYQQFWTTNYQGALWATNGIDTPFTGSKIGLQFQRITDIEAIINTPQPTARITIPGNTLVVGDWIFVNEVVGVTGINLQTGFVTNINVLGNPNNVNVVFPAATLGGAYVSGGIAQYLTSTAIAGVDCIRYYSGNPSVLGQGWVNFMPPLSQNAYVIAEQPAAVYYLAGARMIVPFKDRLLFIGPVIQASFGVPIYLQDTVIYSQNGTPYYTASFTGSPVSSATVFYASLLVPDNQTSSAAAWFEDQTGFGGFQSAALDEPIITVSPNEDVLIMGFNPHFQTRFVYTGNDIAPFNFYIINSELGSSSTFSAITTDKAVISKGPRGYTMASQVDVSRFDLDIPDIVFEVALINNGNERFTAQRDFINEWIYFTYPSNSINYVFPNTTLFYNYRDNSWGQFYESYTTYGPFRPSSGDTWDTITTNWEDWDDPWESGSNTLLQPLVLGGNQQGFILIREDRQTSEATSLLIVSISGNTLTVPNHCLNNGDYILISGALGSDAANLNGKVFSVFNTMTNTFQINPSMTMTNYLGNGYITRYYVPFIQTKQFPTSWGMGRKTRIGAQQYLLTKTNNAQLTLNMYLSQDSGSTWNTGPLVPALDPLNSSLIYSTILFTCPESTNLGLTPANTNLQNLTLIGNNEIVNSQSQIWHRMNTSLIGDTVQVGITLNDVQMRDQNLILQTAEIELHAFILDLSPSSMLS